VTNYRVIIGSNTLVHLECSYRNETGETHNVKSSPFMLPFGFKFSSVTDKNNCSYKSIEYLYNDGKMIKVPVVLRPGGLGGVLYECAPTETIKAVVYVNRNNSADYYVEVYSCKK